MKLVIVLALLQVILSIAIGLVVLWAIYRLVEHYT